MSKGLENLDGILENSRNIIQSLVDAPLSDDLKPIQESLDQLEGLKEKFFMKTVAAIPASKKCLTSSEKALGDAGSYKGDQSDDALDALKKSLQEMSAAITELLEHSQMRGTTLT